MTMSPADIQQKMRQLDIDMQSIYEVLAAIQGTQARHSNRFEELAEQLDAVLEPSSSTLSSNCSAANRRHQADPSFAYA